MVSNHIETKLVNVIPDEINLWRQLIEALVVGFFNFKGNISNHYPEFW